MYSFDLRMYNSDLGRWLSTDPYRQHWSPYLAMSNNPISFIDPDGGYDIPEVVVTAQRNSPEIETIQINEVFSTNRPSEMDGIREVEFFVPAYADLPNTYTPAQLKEAMRKMWDIDPRMGKAIYNSPLISHAEKSRFLYYHDRLDQWNNMPEIMDFLPNTADEILMFPLELYLMASPIKGFKKVPKFSFKSVVKSTPSNSQKWWMTGKNKSTLNTLKPGKYADEFLEGSASRDFRKIRDEMNSIGNKNGCHTCGTFNPGTKSKNWIPDHQSPIAVTETGTFKLYPHCKTCSAIQGGQVRQFKAKTKLFQEN